MADKKISELTNITGANLADGDELVVVDTSASETKAITFGEFKTALDTSTGFVRITGDTMTGDLDIQGTLTSDGLTVDGDTFVQSSSGATLTLKNTNTTVTSGDLLGQLDFYNSDPSGDGPSVQARIKATSAFSTGNGASLGFFTTIGGSGVEGAAPIERMKINQSGDISFYEDTGTTAKFFWDASAESLGIGTSSPSRLLDVSGVQGWENSGTEVAYLNPTATGTDFGLKNSSGTNVVRFDGRPNGDVYFNTGGNVGIGTTSPAYTLDFGTAASGHVIRVGDENQDAYMSFSNPRGFSGYSAGQNSMAIQGGFNKGIVFNVNNGTFGSGEAMRIDSSGNVGIGTSSFPANGTNLKVEDATISRLVLANTGDSTFEFGSLSGGHLNIYDATADAERMRIDSSGNVGIGTTSPVGRLSLQGAAGTNGKEQGILLKYSNGTEYGALGLNNSSGWPQLMARAGAGITFHTNSDLLTTNEAMRIDSSGNLLVGTTTDTGGRVNITRNGIVLRLNTANTSNTAIQFVYNGSSEVGSITTTTTSTAYNTSSDYRLKENVVDLTGATDRLKQLEPKRFNFIADADTTVDGFLAHEVQSVVPEAITGTHNEVDDDGNPVYQGIDQSKLVPLLVATIKELEARITALENA